MSAHTKATPKTSKTKTDKTRTKRRAADESADQRPAVAAEGSLMTNDQAVRLKALAEQALEPEAFRAGLTADEATRRIRALEAKLKAMDGPPHTV